MCIRDSYNMDRSIDPVRERVDRKKMKKKVTREVKHTMRNLHQDSVLIAEARENKLAAKQAIKKDKMNKHKAELEGQQHHYLERSGSKNTRNRKNKQHAQGRKE
eukprot:TRINITY_DN10361_c0_g1_i1.p1 TRINITY_DN10361_c0_g1~~TRINITY_DN10361_c0_g1_i1.p1  ORF type:complete len:104 (-),score=36.49 TRINITY_DN10361_c0_g1_i1:123-434(-)